MTEKQFGVVKAMILHPLYHHEIHVNVAAMPRLDETIGDNAHTSATHQILNGLEVDEQRASIDLQTHFDKGNTETKDGRKGVRMEMVLNASFAGAPVRYVSA